MLEPLAVALHAMKLSGIKNGDSVAIVGTGMIGITAAQWAKKLGADNVTVIGRNESKRAIVEKCDLIYKVGNEKETIGQYNIVLEAVGTPKAIDLSINSAAPGGTVVFMGNPSGNIELSQNSSPVNSSIIYKK